MNAKFRVKALDLEVGKLRLHSGANRELQPARLRYLEQNMDLDALGRFAIWRDGRNDYVVDGQHRKVALENLGLSEWEVRCDVYAGMAFADACELFLKLNNGLMVRPYDKFDKAVKAGHQAEVETKEIIERAGLHVSASTGDGKVACPSAATDVWKLDQGEALARAVMWITEAWGTSSSSLEGQTLRGLGLVAARFNGEIKDPVLIKKLAKLAGGPGALLGRAKGQREIKGGTVARNVAEIVVDLYNKGRGSGQLPAL
jgi:hypothetical protein